MPSFGEIQLLAGSKIIGQIQVKNVYHPRAIFPRIVFQLGFTLVQHSQNTSEIGLPEAEFEIKDCPGELRLEENGNVVGALKWTGARRYIRSYPHHFEDQVEFACDLDWARIDAIEEHRNGGEAEFWVALWPSLTSKQGNTIHCEARPIKTHIPRHKWNELLERLTGLQRTLIEITTPALSSAEFGSTLGHIKKAQQDINQGHIDEAVVSCRRAIESLFRVLDMPNNAQKLEPVLAQITDSERAREYAGILSRLKGLGNVAVHRDEADHIYMRAEARFIVAATAHFVALLATLLRSHSS